TFDIDANGIVHVSARDKATGKEQKIRIESSSGLSDAEIQRMVDDAEKNRAQDEQKKTQAETRNKAETTMHSAKKTMSELGEKFGAEDRATIEGKITAVESALSADDYDAMDTTVSELEQALQAAGEKLYQAAGAGQPEAGAAGGAQQPGAGDADDDVIDAE